MKKIIILLGILLLIPQAVEAKVLSEGYLTNVTQVNLINGVKYKLCKMAPIKDTSVNDPPKTENQTQIATTLEPTAAPCEAYYLILADLEYVYSNGFQGAVERMAVFDDQLYRPSGSSYYYVEGTQNQLQSEKMDSLQLTDPSLPNGQKNVSGFISILYSTQNAKESSVAGGGGTLTTVIKGPVEDLVLGLEENEYGMDSVVKEIGRTPLLTRSLPPSEKYNDAPEQNTMYVAQYQGKQVIFMPYANDSSTAPGSDYNPYLGTIRGVGEYYNEPSYDFRKLQNVHKITNSSLFAPKHYITDIYDMKTSGNMLYLSLARLSTQGDEQLSPNIIISIDLKTFEAKQLWSRDQKKYPARNNDNFFGMASIGQMNMPYVVLSFVSCYQCGPEPVMVSVVANTENSKEIYLGIVTNIKIRKESNSFTYQLAKENEIKCPQEYVDMLAKSNTGGGTGDAGFFECDDKICRKDVQTSFFCQKTEKTNVWTADGAEKYLPLP